MMPAFFLCKESAFFLGKIVPLFRVIVWELCWRCFVLFFSFCKIDCCCWKYRFYRSCIRNPASRRLKIDHKMEKRQWRDNFLTWRHRYFLALSCFSCQVLLLFQVSCHYHDRFWSYDNFHLQRIDQKLGNQKYPRLNFAQYLETEAS